MADEVDISRIALFQGGDTHNNNMTDSGGTITTLTTTSSTPTSLQVPLPLPLTPIIDPFTEYITTIVLYVAVCIVIGIFGTVANIINIIVYVRMGIFNMASNLNLFSLAVGDLGVSVTTFLHGAGFAVIVMDIKDLPFDPFDIVYYVVGWPLSIFSMINRLLTAYVALERCLCVVLPFRIRSMFSVKRCKFYITFIYVYTVLNHLPLYLGHGLEFQKQEGSNLTKLVLTHKAHRTIMHGFVYYSVNFVVTMTTIVVVFVCTVVTSGKIKTSKAWRKSVSGFSSSSSSKASDPKSTQTQTQNNENNESFGNHDNSKNDKDENSSGSKMKMSDETIDKEMRLVKMITTVSIIYLVCYIPDFLLFAMRVFDPNIKFTGAYYRLAQLVYSFALIACAFNSSVNMFVYYRMSTRYRMEFSALLGLSETKTAT